MKKYLYICFLLLTVMSYSENLKVTFISPNKEGDIFWGKVANYMKIAADNLEIDLKVLYPPSNHRSESKKVAEKELNSSDKPDYLVYQYAAQVGKDILQMAEDKKVYSLIFNTNIPEAEKSGVQNVNEKFKYWMGHMYPDDVDAGYKLGKTLIEKAREKNLKGKDGKIHIVALSGSHDSNAAGDRNIGLKKAVAESSDVVIEQIIYVYWDYNKSYDTTLNLYKRYPETTVIWAASDGIALGAIEAIKKLGKVPGEEVLLGGIDWSQEGIDAVKNGQMLSSVGGHVFEGVTSLLLIKDHFEGIKIDSEKFPIKTGMEVMTKEKSSFYENILLYDQFKKIDLKEMSKYYNKDLKTFNFNLLEEIK